jgi:alpha-L-fucosidase
LRFREIFDTIPPMPNPLPDAWKWFADARYGLFIHFGPYSQIGRGEQVLFREQLDPLAYEQQAARWNPTQFDATEWAKIAKRGGFKYAVLTTRHHDGYCLWDSKLTDYTSVAQAPKRDLVREYVEAFREAGLRVGLYYSLADWRVPAYWNDPAADPAAWRAFTDYIHGQVRELLTGYGQIDELWFDAPWPHSAEDWRSVELVRMIKSIQPGILVNNRLDSKSPYAAANRVVESAGESATLGDFGTPEHHITADAHRPWESCQVANHRLWGYAAGEHWRTAEHLLDFLCEAAAKGGNLLLNVGPNGQGVFPPEFVERTDRIGAWLALHREAIANSEPIFPLGRTDVTEFVTRGYQTVKGNALYLIFRFWDESGVLRLADLDNTVRSATLLSTGESLPVTQDSAAITLGLPSEKPCDLYPVVRLDLDAPPRAKPFMRDRLWTGDPKRYIEWARSRGTGVNFCR